MERIRHVPTKRTQNAQRDEKANEPFKMAHIVIRKIQSGEGETERAGLETPKGGGEREKEKVKSSSAGKNTIGVEIKRALAKKAGKELDIGTYVLGAK